MTGPGGRTPILHVAESVGGGVVVAVGDYARSATGYDHHLLAVDLSSAAAPEGEPSSFVGVEALPEGHVRRILRTGAAIRRFKGPVVVHAHSSMAGLYVRLSAPRRTAIVYTPHCFSFERTDVSASVRRIFAFVEVLLAKRRTVFAACSPREQKLARRVAPKAQAVFVPNVAPEVDPGLVRSGAAEAKEPLTVVGFGRIAPQKDPAFFAACIQQLRSAGREVEAVWVGGSDDPAGEDPLRDAGVRITGWVTRAEAIETLAGADVYIHSAAWEGFPIALIEAVELGIPTIVRTIGSLRDWGFGFMVDSPKDIAAVADRILAPGADESRSQFRAELLALCSRENQAARLDECYRLASGSGANGEGGA